MTVRKLAQDTYCNYIAVSEEAAEVTAGVAIVPGATSEAFFADTLRYTVVLLSVVRSYGESCVS